MDFIKQRNPINLNGCWDFCMDPDGGKTDRVLGNDSTLFWRQAEVPCDFAHACPEQPLYQNICWFKREMLVPKDMAGKRLVLRFEAVNYTAVVFLNGKFVGRSTQGFVPFEFDVSSFVKVGETNTLLVMVDNRREEGDLPTVFFWRNVGGIIRDVWLYATNELYIENAYVTANHTGCAVFEGILGGCKESLPEDATINVTIKDNGGTIIESASSTLLPGSTSNCGCSKLLASKSDCVTRDFSLPIQCDSIRTWSPDSPNLYHANISLSTGEKIDEVEFYFGFRTIEVKDGLILLNGEPIFFKGYDRHEDHPDCGGALSRPIVDEDFACIKASGANFIRMCHYPHDSYELEVADRLGLILLVEVPVNSLLRGWNLDKFPVESTRIEQVFRNAKDMLTRMIARDRSHPSVCFWSVSNETQEDIIEVNDINNTLIQYAKKLDPSRLCVHVSMPPFVTNNKAAENFIYDDVICFNTYVTLGTRHGGRKLDYDMNESAKTLRGIISRLNELYPGKPVIVTEYGYCTDHAIDGIEDENLQAAGIEAEYLALREVTQGVALWCYADYIWPQSADNNGYMAIAPELATFGAMTRDRKPRKAFTTLSKLMQEK